MEPRYQSAFGLCRSGGRPRSAPPTTIQEEDHDHDEQITSTHFVLQGSFDPDTFKRPAQIPGSRTRNLLIGFVATSINRCGWCFKGLVQDSTSFMIAPGNSQNPGDPPGIHWPELRRSN